MMEITALVDTDTAFDIALVCAKKGYYFTVSNADNIRDEEE